MSTETTEGDASGTDRPLDDHIGVDVNGEFKHRIRIQAANERRPMSELIREALRDYMDE